MNISYTNSNIVRITAAAVFIIGYIASASYVEAASLSLSPGSGTYAPGATFTVRLSVNSAGASINAADGTIKFDPSQLNVVSATRSGSIFNLWVTEPTFSNTAGTVTFSGGLPSGYTGNGGNIMSVTFKAKGSGTSKVTIAGASVLANDGQGTNVLSSSGNASFSIQAAALTPTPVEENNDDEVVVEYTPQANTPSAPKITSTTHSDPNAWYSLKSASLDWELPAGIIAVRTLLDDRASSIPTKVYDSPIKTIGFDLDEGISYFHLQFKNEEGWGKIAHYRLAVDSEKPTGIAITQSDQVDKNAPEQKFLVTVEDAVSKVLKFKVQLDNNEPFDFKKETIDSLITVGKLTPGYHTITIEGFDEAGNSIIGTYSFTIEAFEAPVFTEIPVEVSSQVIPVIKGTTRPNSTVDIIIMPKGGEARTYQTNSDESGVFVFIPDSRFGNGVYEITARAIDQYGAQSELSKVSRLAVQQPGFIKIGFLIVSALSVIIPLILLAGLAVVASWYMVLYLRRLRRKIRIESVEALEIMKREFKSLDDELTKQEGALIDSRKTKKLTGAEQNMISTIRKALVSSENKVEKEMIDVAKLTSQTE